MVCPRQRNYHGRNRRRLWENASGAQGRVGIRHRARTHAKQVRGRCGALADRPARGMLAAAHALSDAPGAIHILTDSKYVANTLNRMLLVAALGGSTLTFGTSDGGSGRSSKESPGLKRTSPASKLCIAA